MQTLLRELPTRLRAELGQLLVEFRTIDRDLVRPSWVQQTHHFPSTLYGLVMGGFASIDLYSVLWDGDRQPQQTARMRAFLWTYLHRDPLADAIAVQLWRHTLMHTSRPRRLRNTVSGREYDYLLHWGATELPKDQHWQVSEGGTFALALEFLLEDVARALDGYLAELALSADLQARLAAVWPRITTQEFKA